MAFQEKLAKIIAGIDTAVDIAVKDATATIAGRSTSRIFDKGQAANESQIGTYSNPYKETRKKKGLQTAFVDLTFSGNLNKTIVHNENKVYFKNEYGREVSGHNERTFGKRIFAPTKTERQIVVDILNEEIAKLWKS